MNPCNSFRTSHFVSTRNPTANDKSRRVRAALNTLEFLEPRRLFSISWSAGPVLPAARGDAAALGTDLGVLLLGGASGTTTPTTATLLSAITNTWVSAPAL